MNYLDSITDFFKSPKWMMNLLLAGICSLIPVVGPIVVMGWLITGFWVRTDERAETFPEFDFNQFGKYLERGLWPFLVTLALVFGVWLALVVVTIPVSFIASQMGKFIGGLFGFLISLVYLAAGVAIIAVLKPVVLRAILTQDFMKSFDIPFIKRFITLTWKEIILSTLFIIAAANVLSIVGFLAFCIGIIFVAPVVYYSWMHLDKQLYKIYLSRGGEAIFTSPKLTDIPPTPPVV